MSNEHKYFGQEAYKQFFEMLSAKHFAYEAKQKRDELGQFAPDEGGGGGKSEPQGRGKGLSIGGKQLGKQIAENEEDNKAAAAGRKEQRRRAEADKEPDEVQSALNQHLLEQLGQEPVGRKREKSIGHDTERPEYEEARTSGWERNNNDPPELTADEQAGNAAILDRLAGERKQGKDALNSDIEDLKALPPENRGRPRKQKPPAEFAYAKNRGVMFSNENHDNETGQFATGEGNGGQKAPKEQDGTRKPEVSEHDPNLNKKDPTTWQEALDAWVTTENNKLWKEGQSTEEEGFVDSGNKVPTGKTGKSKTWKGPDSGEDARITSSVRKGFTEPEVPAKPQNKALTQGHINEFFIRNILDNDMEEINQEVGHVSHGKNKGKSQPKPEGPETDEQRQSRAATAKNRKQARQQPAEEGWDKYLDNVDPSLRIGPTASDKKKKENMSKKFSNEAYKTFFEMLDGEKRRYSNDAHDPKSGQFTSGSGGGSSKSESEDKPKPKSGDEPLGDITPMPKAMNSTDVMNSPEKLFTLPDKVLKDSNAQRLENGNIKVKLPYKIGINDATVEIEPDGTMNVPDGFRGASGETSPRMGKGKLAPNKPGKSKRQQLKQDLGDLDQRLAKHEEDNDLLQDDLGYLMDDHERKAKGDDKEKMQYASPRLRGPSCCPDDDGKVVNFANDNHDEASGQFTSDGGSGQKKGKEHGMVKKAEKKADVLAQKEAQQSHKAKRRARQEQAQQDAQPDEVDAALQKELLAQLGEEPLEKRPKVRSTNPDELEHEDLRGKGAKEEYKMPSIGLQGCRIAG